MLFIISIILSVTVSPMWLLLNVWYIVRFMD